VAEKKEAIRSTARRRAVWTEENDPAGPQAEAAHSESKPAASVGTKAARRVVLMNQIMSCRLSPQESSCRKRHPSPVAAIVAESVMAM